MDEKPKYTGYVPRSLGEIWDYLGAMMLESPTFKDDYITEKSIDTVFNCLNEGLESVRPKVGEEKYAALIALSGRMKALFEADPKDETGETVQGRELILEMEDILRPPSTRRRFDD
jgi:hypothetical protein